MTPSGINRGFLEEVAFEPGLKEQEDKEDDIKARKTAPVKARREGAWHRQVLVLLWSCQVCE